MEKRRLNYAEGKEKGKEKHRLNYAEGKERARENVVCPKIKIMPKTRKGQWKNVD